MNFDKSFFQHCFVLLQEDKEPEKTPEKKAEEKSEPEKAAEEVKAESGKVDDAADDKDDEEGEFEPTVDMIMNDFDDERTMEEEEALEAAEEDTGAFRIRAVPIFAISILLFLFFRGGGCGT